MEYDTLFSKYIDYCRYTQRRNTSNMATAEVEIVSECTMDT